MFAIVWIALAVSPRYREAWVLENLLTVVAVPAAVLTYRRYPISDRGYVLATAFLVLHTIGSHYTYSEVPLGAWAQDVFGWSRNHYDRLVHFAFGLLMCRPLRELVIRRPAVLGPLPTMLVGVALVALASVAYEVVEWWTAVVSDPEAGTAFLGTQGDEWDAQWDMALACGGGILASAAHALGERRGATAGARRRVRQLRNTSRG